MCSGGKNELSSFQEQDTLSFEKNENKISESKMIFVFTLVIVHLLWWTNREW